MLGVRRWTERWEIPKQVGVSPWFRNKGLRPCSTGKGEGDGSGEPRMPTFFIGRCTGLDWGKVCLPQPLSTKERSSMLETALPMGIPGVWNMCFYQERASSPKATQVFLWNGCWYRGPWTGAFTVHCNEKETSTHGVGMLAHLPPGSLLIGLPCPGWCKAQPQAQLPL